ncbi:MAG: cupin domain-containing protein [Leptolyngbyaceae cyanobacterium]
MSLPGVLMPGEGESVVMGNSSCTFKVTGEDTNGHFGIFEFTLNPETPAFNPHIHKQMVEIFYVLEGEVELFIDGETVVAPSGTCATVPQNTPHAFANPGSGYAKMLIMFCPEISRRQYFEGLSELTKEGRQPSREEIQELARQFDQYPAP